MPAILERLDALGDDLARRSMDLGTALDRIRWAVAEALEGDRATLYLVDHVTGELVSRSADLPGLNAIRLKLGEGLAGQVAAEGRPHHLRPDEPRTEAARRTDAETGYHTRSMLAVPLLSSRRVIGVLQVLNKRHGTFDAADERLLTAIAARLVRILGTTSLAAQLEAGQRRSLSFRFNHIIGGSPAMLALYDLLGRAAKTDITVLLRGESGTGKNLVARALHDNSPRETAPFVAVDCGSIPEHLIENELFGHEAGAYTGADHAAPGKVAAAEGGTLFLDEVGELSPEAQRKLLRLLQDRSYYPVGSTTLVQADVRFVCATNVDLEEAVDAGRFRRDLLYRLRVVELEVPPLRSRTVDDIDRLVDHFLYEHGRRHDRPGMSLTDAARARLRRYDWPGNVRELENVLEAAVVLTPNLTIDANDLRLRDAATPGIDTRDGFRVGKVQPLRDVADAYVAWAVAQQDGNKSAAARALEISRTTLGAHLDRVEG